MLSRPAKITLKPTDQSRLQSSSVRPDSSHSSRKLQRQNSKPSATTVLREVMGEGRRKGDLHILEIWPEGFLAWNAT